MASQTRARKPAPKRASPARRPPAKKAPRKPAPRRTARRRAPLIDVGQGRDLVGLGLLAVAAFAVLVVWFGVEGGPFGRGLDDLLRALVGRLAAIAPLLLAGAAVLCFGPRVRGARLGAIGVGVGVALAGLVILLGSDAVRGDAARAHSGIAGGLLHGGVTHVAGDVGATLLGVVLLLAGVLLATGASVAAIVVRSRHEVRKTAVAVRDVLGERTWNWPDRSPREEPAAPEQPARAAVASVKTAPKAASRPLYDAAHELSDDDPTGVVAPEVAVAAAAANWHDEPVDESLPVPVSTLPVPHEPTAEPGALSAQPQLVPADDLLGSAPEPDIDYRLPDAASLRRGRQSTVGQHILDRTGQTLVEALAHFNVEARVVGTVTGPRVTRYELRLAPGTKVGKVAALKDDLAYALATTDIRILAPIPGKQAVGVELPNPNPNLITLGDIWSTFPQGASPLSVWLGKDIAGENVWGDLAKMPHILIAGTTGSGKSGCLNAMLMSILLNATPQEARLILIDPKRVELNHYEAIPHLLTPVVTNMKHAAAVLMNVVGEMERRYEQLGTARARNIVEFNRARREAERETLPYILVVIDELADLMMVAPAEVEDCIIRLAQKSRAVGIHLVLATQRPSVDVITGMIKANVPSRIAFAVSSMTDSRVILDTPGAESLLGQGDMLYRPIGTSRLHRIQGAYVTEEEIALVVEQCRRQGEPELEMELLDMPSIVAPDDDGRGEGELDPDEDDLLDEAIRLVVQHETASVSLIQRRLRVGYTRAGRLIDMLERRGVISGYEGSKPRQVLVTEADLARVLAHGDAPAAAVPGLAAPPPPPWEADPADRP